MKWMAKNVIAIGLDNGTIRIYDFDQNQSTVRVIKEFKHDVYWMECDYEAVNWK